MTNLDLLKGKPFVINNIAVKHPTVEEICDYGEENYYSAINLFLMRPSDLMVQLYDSGVDWTTITSYDVFIILCSEIKFCKNENKPCGVQLKLEWLTGISDFEIFYDDNISMHYLYSESANAKIDKGIYLQIRKYLMSINFRDDKEKYNPGNETTKKIIVEEERKRIKREMKRKFKSILSQQISSLVWGNTCGMDYQRVLGLCVYQFFDGLIRISKIKNYDNTMFGYYSGNISAKTIEGIKEKIDWMS